MPAKVPESGFDAFQVCDRLPDRAGDENLAAVSGETDSSCGIHSKPDVAGVGQRRPAGVKADSD